MAEDLKDHTSEIISALSQMEKINKGIGQRWKALAYAKAIRSIKEYGQPIYRLEDVRELEGIGKSIYDKIGEIIETDKLEAIEELAEKNEILTIFTGIHGVGPETAKKWLEKGYTSLTDLKKEKLTSAQKMGIKYYDDFMEKIPRKQIDHIKAHLKYVVDCINKSSNINLQFLITGSYRRGAKESGDIDIIMFEKNDKLDKEFLIELLKEYNIISDELSSGSHKFMGVTKLLGTFPARRLDIEWVTYESLPYAMLYFTGSAQFNTMIRGKAKEKGWTLNEKGLFRRNGSNVMEGEIGTGQQNEITEADILSKLGIDMKYSNPKNR